MFSKKSKMFVIEDYCFFNSNLVYNKLLFTMSNKSLKEQLSPSPRTIPKAQNMPSPSSLSTCSPRDPKTSQEARTNQSIRSPKVLLSLKLLEQEQKYLGKTKGLACADSGTGRSKKMSKSYHLKIKTDGDSKGLPS